MSAEGQPQTPQSAHSPAQKPAAPEGKGSCAAHSRHAIILRPWPKIVFFYPTLLASFIVGVLQLIEKGEGTTAGLAFFAIFAFNLLVIAFEFSRLKSVAIFFLVLSITFLLLWLSKMFPVFSFIKDIIAGLQIKASTSFYFAVGIYLLLVFVGMFINTRWNYYEVHHNEIVHHTGFLGDIKRFPSPNLKMTKEISDVFEFMLLGSGRIILYPASEKEAIVLDNVLSVNRVEREMKKLLSAIEVEVAAHGPDIEKEDH